jgi:uncharacterized protein (DUF305 family)
MGIAWRWSILLISFWALATQAPQQGSNAQVGVKSAADPGWTELNDSIQKMHVSMASVKSSGNSDIDFVRLMLPHHQAAIEMAKTQLMYGKDPQMRRLAQEIITDQQSEIELMQLWLKQHESQK